MLIPFYRRPEFQGVPGRASQPTIVPGHFVLEGAAGLRRNQILSQFGATCPEYVGILRGEYIALDNGMALIDRDGQVITINVAKDDITAIKDINEHFLAESFQAQVFALIAHWESIQMLDRVAVIAHPYGHNFFHFVCETVTKLRFLGEFDVDKVAMPAFCLRRPFQRDLLARTLGERLLLPMSAPLRVRDPVLIHGYLSAAGLHWLRDKAGCDVQPGTRNLYIHRTNQTRSTPGDCVADSDAFTALLREFAFEPVDFGSGDLTIAQQVARLDQAGIILTVHGAALTNCAFLRPPVAIVELFGKRVFGGFMDIAASLDFRYHGIVCDDFDAEKNIVVDCARLREALRRLS